MSSAVFLYYSDDWEKVDGKNNRIERKLYRRLKWLVDLYRKHLVGKRFLYVFEGRYIEVLYKAANFRHLTGVATNLSAKKFYRLCSKKDASGFADIFYTAAPFFIV